MIAVDTNILIYSHRIDSPFHQKADQRLTGLAESGKPWAIPWPCLHEFLAIVTHPRIYNPPTPPEKAMAQVECWLECPTLHLIGETDGYWDTLKGQLTASKTIGPRIHDTRIAAICLQHNIETLWSADRDFSRMRGLRIDNPLL